jgi:hypothetical protein
MQENYDYILGMMWGKAVMTYFLVLSSHRGWRKLRNAHTKWLVLRLTLKPMFHEYKAGLLKTML